MNEQTVSISVYFLVTASLGGMRLDRERFWSQMGAGTSKVIVHSPTVDSTFSTENKLKNTKLFIILLLLLLLIIVVIIENFPTLFRLSFPPKRNGERNPHPIPHPGDLKIS